MTDLSQKSCAEGGEISTKPVLHLFCVVTHAGCTVPWRSLDSSFTFFDNSFVVLCPSSLDALVPTREIDLLFFFFFLPLQQLFNIMSWWSRSTVKKVLNDVIRYFLTHLMMMMINKTTSPNRKWAPISRCGSEARPISGLEVQVLLAEGT